MSGFKAIDNDLRAFLRREGVNWILRTLDGPAISMFLNLEVALDGLCESPIEQRMLIAMWFGFPKNTGSDYDLDVIDTRLPPDMQRSDAHMFIVPQWEVGYYRVDFMIEERMYSPVENPLRVIVECDGHDFHERTKEQARHDKRRDRYLTAEGYPILRFTGSEIYADAARCAAEVWALMEAKLEPLRYQWHADARAKYSTSKQQEASAPQ